MESDDEFEVLYSSTVGSPETPCLALKKERAETSLASSTARSVQINRRLPTYVDVCSVKGCQREAVSCYHCGLWLCDLDIMVHTEKILDEQLKLIRSIQEKASALKSSVGSKDFQKFTEIAINQSAVSANCDIKRWSLNLKSALNDLIDSRAAVLQAKVDSILHFELQKLEHIFRRLETLKESEEKLDILAGNLETKNPRRLNLSQISASISEAMRDVVYLENVDFAKPAFVNQNPAIEDFLSLMRDMLSASSVADCVGHVQSLSSYQHAFAERQRELETLNKPTFPIIQFNKDYKKNVFMPPAITDE